MLHHWCFLDSIMYWTNSSTLWQQQRSEHWDSSKHLRCDAFMYLTLLLSLFALIFLYCCCALILDFVFQQGKVSLVVVSCCFSTALPLRNWRKRIGYFSDTKDLPFTVYCFENHICVVKRSGREHLQMEEEKNYLVHWHGFLCIRDGQVIESWAPLQQNKTYPVINPYKLDVCC